jgi:hypothetical protein
LDSVQIDRIPAPSKLNPPTQTPTHEALIGEEVEARLDVPLQVEVQQARRVRRVQAHGCREMLQLRHELVGD